MLQDKALNIANNIGHGFFGSDYPVRGAGALPAALPGFDIDRVLIMKQTHGDRCLIIREAYDNRTPPEADAMVTDRENIILSVQTADCAPVLFAGKKVDGSVVIGAAHAGWQGAFSGILEASIEQMCHLGLVEETLTASIGPCIGPESYEVGPEFYERFLSRPDNDCFFVDSGKAGHYHFDLPGYVEKRLEKAGCTVSRQAWRDTYSCPDSFFSYRRAVHNQRPNAGRQLSVITIIAEGG